jgi:hypothetical protein
MQCHPEALVDPEISILDNITHWSHGELVGELDEGLPAYQLKKKISKTSGNGFAIDTSFESAMVQQMLDLVMNWPGCVVIQEDFIVQQFNQSRDFLAPVRIIAAMDYALWRNGIQAFRQLPSEKSGATDARLKAWGFYSTGSDHQRDGDRHNLVFFRKMKDMNKGRFRRHLAWPHIFNPAGEIIDA